MKKTIAFVIVICVTAALFASVGITVRAGGTFGFANLKTYSKVSEEETQYKVHGFGFDGSVQYDISDRFMIYADYNMLFPKDVVYTVGGQELIISEWIKEIVATSSLFDEGSYGVDYYSISAGAAYKLDLGNQMRLAIGAGISFDHLKSFTLLIKHKKTRDNTTRSVAIVESFGLNAMLDARYMINDNIGVGLTVMPQVGLYNFTKIENSFNDEIDEEYSDTVNGFTVSFAMPITVGVSYSF